MPDATRRRSTKQVQLTSDVTNQYPDFAGTPTFIINGSCSRRPATWEKLEPQLDEALK